MSTNGHNVIRKLERLFSVGTIYTKKGRLEERTKDRATGKGLKPILMALKMQEYTKKVKEYVVFKNWKE